MDIKNKINITCPYCGSEISKTAKKCMNCGEWLPEEKKCPHCSENITSDDFKCPHCGELVEKETFIAIGHLLKLLYLTIGLSALIYIVTNNGVVGMLFYISLLILFNFIPTIVANKNKHQYTGAICLLNLIFGWTGIVWIILLAWASNDKLYIK